MLFLRDQVGRRPRDPARFGDPTRGPVILRRRY
jgi:hypothetical protein